MLTSSLKPTAACNACRFTAHAVRPSRRNLVSGCLEPHLRGSLKPRPKEHAMSHPTDFHALIEAAVRAPSGHNSQPWQFALGDDRITIAPDFSRRLSAVDPDNRELFISLGCALENLCLAAAHSGYAAQEHLADDGTVHIALHQQPEPTKQPENEALYAQIPRRQTNRATYNDTPIPPAQLDPILVAQQSDTVSLHAFAPSAPEFATLTQAVIAGNSAQMNDPAFKAELLSWIRFNQNHSNATRDGLSYAVMGAPNLPAWISRPIIRAMLNAKRQNRSYRAKIASSSHLLLIASTEDNPATWLATGRTLQRTLLALTQHGIAHAYLNQPCEVPAQRAQLAQLPALGGKQPQILLRLGYAAAMPYSQRRAVDSVIQTTQAA